MSSGNDPKPDSSGERVDPVKVYLDTSSWASIERAPPGDGDIELLRQLGKTGAVVFLVSFETLMEVPNRSPGLERRLEMMRQFPGTFEVRNVSAERLFEREGSRLASCVMPNTAPIEPLQIELTPLIARSVTELADGVRYLGLARSAHAGMAFAERISRRNRKGMKKDAIRKQDLSVATLLRAPLEQTAVGPARKAVARLVQPLVDFAMERAVRRGLFDPEDPRPDPIFGTTVVPCLPIEARRDPLLLSRIRKVWRSEQRMQLAPGLSCRAAVVERLYYMPKEVYEASQGVDERHVAYVPLVDIFTCDQSTHAALTQKKETVPGVAIVRSTQLTSIVEAALRAVQTRLSVSSSRVEGEP